MSKDLYVKNLPFDITEEEIRKFFSVAGKVSYIHMGKDPKSGEFRGFGYVKMASQAEAKEAILCLDGARIKDCNIVVKIAREQKPSGPGNRKTTKKSDSPNQRQKRRK
jgi:RNA recognition motif-containing protein